MDLAHLSSQGNMDGTSVKENIGHSYIHTTKDCKRKYRTFIHSYIHTTKDCSFPQLKKKKKKKRCFNTLTIQSLRNVNEPKKAFKVNVELDKIARNQYFLLFP